MDEKDIYEKAEEIRQKGIDDYKRKKKQKEEEAARQPMNAKKVYEEAKEIVREVLGLKVDDVIDPKFVERNTTAILSVARTIVDEAKFKLYETGLEKMAELLADKQPPPSLVVPFASVSTPEFKPGGKFFGSGDYRKQKLEDPYPEMPPTVRADHSSKATDHILLYRNQFGSRMVILYDSDEDRDRELKRIEDEGGTVIEFYHTTESGVPEHIRVAERMAELLDEARENAVKYDGMEERIDERRQKRAKIKKQLLAEEDAAMREQQQREETKPEAAAKSEEEPG